MTRSMVVEGTAEAVADMEEAAVEAMEEVAVEAMEEEAMEEEAVEEVVMEAAVVEEDIIAHHMGVEVAVVELEKLSEKPAWKMKSRAKEISFVIKTSMCLCLCM
ncbi:hypothetical protein LguiA_013502 [Lonicera macranthoides]